MKLLSWNIQWGRGIDGCVDLARIVRTIQQLGIFDVIYLQEVAVNFPGLPGNSEEDQVIELVRLLPGYTTLYGIATDVPDNHGGRSQFGNAIFTRLPVGQVWRHLLPCQVGLTTPSMQRVLVEAVVTADIGPLRIMTTISNTIRNTSAKYKLRRSAAYIGKHVPCRTVNFSLKSGMEHLKFSLGLQKRYYAVTSIFPPQHRSVRKFWRPLMMAR